MCWVADYLVKAAKIKFMSHCHDATTAEAQVMN
jgi:hypothetical protein